MDYTDPLSDARIVESWHRNAAPWTTAVRAHEIESRRLVTDRAILDVIHEHAPRTLLDLGCGEGWLIRALGGTGMRLIGVDVVPELIDRANHAGGGEFHVASYESIAAGDFRFTADVVVCNFSLLGKESVEATCAAVRALLTPGGVLIVQTLHPLVACGDLPYRDGWRAGSWQGFNNQFCDPPPWYFRTLSGWISLFRDAGLCLQSLREPVHPVSARPASVIFVAGVMR
jgi:2-polyprenyl-3-methyl-5-hydroxy-6-metoxy-1,4-benzoquinol methylase